MGESRTYEDQLLDAEEFVRACLATFGQEMTDDEITLLAEDVIECLPPSVRATKDEA